MAFIELIRTNRTVRYLLALGLLSEAVYVAYFLNWFYLPRYYNVPFLDIGKLSGHSVTGGLVFLAAFSALFAAYYAGYRLCLEKRGLNGSGGDATGIWLVLGFAVLFNLTLIFIYPVGAADVFDYIFHGRILVHYGHNPFQSLIANYPNDPFFPYAAWKYAPSVYGPIWIILSAIPSLLGGDNLLLNIILYKTLVSLLLLLTAWLAYRTLQRLAPRYALAGTLLLAWNPLAIYETAGNGHNDVAMAFFTLLGAYFFASERRTSAILGWCAAGLVKFITGLLAPLFLVAFLKQIPRWPGRIGFAIRTGLLCLMLAVALYAPFWIGSSIFGIEQRQGMFTDSLPTIAMLLLTRSTGQQQAQMTVSLIAAVSFALLVVALPAWRIARADFHPTELLAVSFDILYLYVLFLCQWFQPWYLLWILPLAAVIPRLDIANKAMLFSYTAIWSYFVFSFVLAWYAERLDLLAIQICAVAAVYTLPIIYTLGSLLANRRRVQPTSQPMRKMHSER